MEKKISFFAAIFILSALTAIGWFYLGNLIKKPAEEKNYKVAVVLLGGAYDQSFSGLKQGMEDLGYKEDKNIFYSIRDTQGNQQAVAPATEDLIKENPDAFYTISTPATTEAWKVIGDRFPIVFNIVGDPVGAGLIADFSSSGNNLTGCSNLSAILSGKRLEVFKEAFPSLKKAVTFYNPGNKHSMIAINNTRETVSKVGVEVEEFALNNIEELKAVLTALEPGEYDGIFLTPDAMVVSKIELVIAKAKELGLPIMGHEESLAQKGVTLTYGADFYKIGTQCAPLLLGVLNGQKPQDIPVQSPAELYTVVNLKSAQESGLVISSEVLGEADKIIK